MMIWCLQSARPPSPPMSFALALAVMLCYGQVSGSSRQGSRRRQQDVRFPWSTRLTPCGGGGIWARALLCESVISWRPIAGAVAVIVDRYWFGGRSPDGGLWKRAVRRATIREKNWMSTYGVFHVESARSREDEVVDQNVGGQEQSPRRS